MHKTRYRALVLSLYRHDEAIRAHGDYRLLQRLCIGRRGNYLLQGVAHSRACRSYLSADIRKLGRCAVGYLVLSHYGGRYLFLKKSVRMQGGKQIVNACFSDGIVGDIALDEPCTLQYARDVKKLSCIERSAEVSAV